MIPASQNISFDDLLDRLFLGQEKWPPMVMPYPPSINNMYPVVRGRHILSAEGRGFKKSVAVLALAAGIRPLDGDVECKIDIFRPRKAGDLDNTLKAVLDSLKGVAFHDDRQVTAIYTRRHEDKSNPRAVVIVRPSIQAEAEQLFKQRSAVA